MCMYIVDNLRSIYWLPRQMVCICWYNSFIFYSKSFDTQIYKACIFCMKLLYWFLDGHSMINVLYIHLSIYLRFLIEMANGKLFILCIMSWLYKVWMIHRIEDINTSLNTWYCYMRNVYQNSMHILYVFWN